MAAAAEGLPAEILKSRALQMKGYSSTAIIVQPVILMPAPGSSAATYSKILTLTQTVIVFLSMGYPVRLIHRIFLKILPETIERTCVSAQIVRLLMLMCPRGLSMPTTVREIRAAEVPAVRSYRLAQALLYRKMKVVFAVRTAQSTQRTKVIPVPVIAGYRLLSAKALTGALACLQTVHILSNGDMPFFQAAGPED